MARKPVPPADTCPYCGQGSSLQISVVARHGRTALFRSMWCASCRGTYLALRRLLPDVKVVDHRRRRPVARFDPEKLRHSITVPVRKPPGDGFRDPYSGEVLPAALEDLAVEFVLSFVLEELARREEAPNDDLTTDQIAAVTLATLYRLHPLAFLRAAVHHRLFPRSATQQECDELAEITRELTRPGRAHIPRQDSDLPALREPPAPVQCPRCGAFKVSRRSRSRTDRGLEQQPASCSNCGQRYIWEWGAQTPMTVISRGEESLFDLVRFRTGIRSAVRKLPGPAAVWSDEKLVATAASNALVAATPYIQRPDVERSMPAIYADDLWLAAASALRAIHPLAFVRYAVHSGALAALDWQELENARRLERMVLIVREIGRRYFESPAFLRKELES